MTEKIFMPDMPPAARALHKKATKLVASMQAAEVLSGIASPENLSVDAHLRTVIAALCAGLSSQDWNCVAEALAMLQSAELRVRK